MARDGGGKSEFTNSLADPVARHDMAPQELRKTTVLTPGFCAKAVSKR